MFSRFIDSFREAFSVAGDIVAILAMVLILIGAGWMVVTAFDFLKPFVGLGHS